jgi:tetrapyrrole methylase family protein/MazG family protein
VEKKRDGTEQSVNDGLKEEYAALYGRRDGAGDALERLRDIIRLLRGENGCPWDKEQTHESIRQCMIEEAYEAKDAIDRGDMDNLEEELGDVLLQVVFHGDIGCENGTFDLISIANRVSDKMIRRHPHIFSKENIKTIDKVIEKWENVKRQEKGMPSHTEILRDIPKALPALTRSCKVQAKAAKTGFDHERVQDAFSKVEEEMKELLDAYQDGEPQARLKDELGDLLFSVVNVARFMEIDPEDALNGTSQKFIERFCFIETAANSSGKTLEQMTAKEMDKLWRQAKQAGNRSANPV